MTETQQKRHTKITAEIRSLQGTMNTHKMGIERAKSEVVKIQRHYPKNLPESMKNASIKEERRKVKYHTGTLKRQQKLVKQLQQRLKALDAIAGKHFGKTK